MAIKLIALDIDGTLTSKAQEVSQRNRDAVKAAIDAGVFVTLATGRGCIATRPIWRILEIHGPSIQYGGALTVDADTEKPLSMHALDPALIQEILEFAVEVGVHAQIYVNDVVIFEKTSPAAEHYVARHKLPFEIDLDIRKKRYENVPKILAFSALDVQDEMLEAFRTHFRGKAQVSRSLPGFIEINCLNTTKGTALEELARMLNIPREHVAAIGDNYLDQEMIEWAGTGACVADGAESVKEVADVVIPTCDEDGVAYFIEHYVL